MITQMTDPRRKRAVAVVAGAVGAVLAVVAALVFAALPTEAAGHGIHAEPLTVFPDHHEFTDDVAIQVRDKPDGRSTEVVNLRDASRIAVVEFTIEPGAWFHWHTHPGAVLASVVAGELVFIYADDCVERRYDAGEAFVDPGVVHTAYNPTEDDTVVIATILGAEAEAPPATNVDADEGAALNDKCDTDAPTE